MADQQALAGESAARLDDNAVQRGLDRLTARHLRAVAALVLLSLLCFLPGLASIAPVDRDEARFVQATKQMLETGDYVDIRMHDEPRYKKPVGIYWLQAALIKLTGQGAEAGIGAYRLVSVAGAVSAVLLLYWATLPMFGRRAAFVAAAALGLSVIVTVEAHLAKTDAVLLATVILAQGALARVYLHKGVEKPSIGTALLFWTGIGLGALIKGPVIVMISGLTIVGLIAVDRKARWLTGLRPLVGIPLALMIVLPWFAAILSIAGTDFLTQSFGTDLFGKLGGGAEGHGAPPGAHFVVFWFVFWPAAAIVPLAVPWVWRNRGTDAVRFCLAWLIPNWVVFELVVTKLPHYTLPTYPAIAALLGGAAVAGLAAGKRWTRWGTVPAAILAVALPAAGVAALLTFEGTASIPGVAAVAIVAILIGLGVRAAFRDAPLSAGVWLGASAVVSYLYVFIAVLPALDTFRIAPRLAEAIEAGASCPNPQVIAAGFQEPSLIFLVGTGIRLADGHAAAEFLAEGGCRIVLVDQRQRKEFRLRARALGVATRRLDLVEGINIGHFRRVVIGVFAPAGGSGE